VMSIAVEHGRFQLTANRKDAGSISATADIRKGGCASLDPSGGDS
jgi:hypothetical protein